MYGIELLRLALQTQLEKIKSVPECEATNAEPIASRKIGSSIISRVEVRYVQN